MRQRLLCFTTALVFAAVTLPMQASAMVDCAGNRMACEDDCYEQFGGGWLGSLSPSYIACVDECSNIEADCYAAQVPPPPPAPVPVPVPAPAPLPADGQACMDARSACEDFCWQTYAQGFFGTYNPSYWACVDQCAEAYDTCMTPTVAPPPIAPPPVPVGPGTDCVGDRVDCEDFCIDEYGGGWLGTMSPSYIACIYECDQMYAECQQAMNTIDDGTISWEQPTPDAQSPYWGYCGPTSAANLVSMYCGRTVTPMEFASCTFNWTNPGTLPSDLADCLNTIGNCGTWEVCNADATIFGDPLTELGNNAPTSVLLDWDGSGTMHWVTVVGVDMGPPCEVTFNHWGRQETLDCNEFTNRWSMTNSTAGMGGILVSALDPFTYLCMTAPPGAP